MKSKPTLRRVLKRAEADAMELLIHRWASEGAIAELSPAAGPARDPLENLISAASELIESLGVPVPQSRAECAAAIEQRRLPVANGFKLVSINALEYDALLTPRLMRDPVLAALFAYSMFLSAQSAKEQGRPEVALDFVASGSIPLARACSIAESTEAEALRAKGGRAKHARSGGKVEAKEKAKELWRERLAGQHPKLRTNEQFALEVCRRWPVLTSVETVKKWCTAWHKEERP